MDPKQSGSERRYDAALDDVRQKFRNFLSLLDHNHIVLGTISELEQKSQGKGLLDVDFITTRLYRIYDGVHEMVDRMVDIGGEKYEVLRERANDIDSRLQRLIPSRHPVLKDDFTVVFDKIRSERALSVGSKNAQLGEMKGRLGLPVPDGFAISAWAYKHFLEYNNLQSRINGLLDGLDIKSHGELIRVSDRIRAMISSARVPPDLATAIKKSRDELRSRCSAERFSMRSSAIGEDSLFSFAGQYASYLNVRGRELIDRYKDVIAGKFTPKAIFYLLSHSLEESDQAMSVGCVAMVEAAASGVAYTRDPINPDTDYIMVNSIYGLGRYLVDGSITPDVFKVDRKSGKVIERTIADKHVRLVLRVDGGTVDEPVPLDEQSLPSMTDNQLAELAFIAAKVEDYYQVPQDIEWAIDHSGELFILQTRPLRVMHSEYSSQEDGLSLESLRLLRGTTASPGAGAGRVFSVASPRDLANVPDGVVLAAEHPFPGLVTVMERISALVTEVGGIVSHMATIAREYRVPALVGVRSIDTLESGMEVTVDATGGVVYQGILSELVQTRKRQMSSLQDVSIIRLLQRLLSLISSLNLINPADESFAAENCQTIHDITRFAHQKAVEEMFNAAEGLGSGARLGVRLKTDIPLEINVIFIDESFEKVKGKEEITEDEITSDPMREFWSGIVREGWPRAKLRSETKLETASISERRGKSISFAESSFAILSSEYMMVGLHMGYHFTTIEAMCTEFDGRNFVKMQYKEGGAALDRRIRRVKLIEDILSGLGFESESSGDFFRSSIAYLGRERILKRLHIIGRLTMLTKQLDMALHNDAIAEWYTQDIKRKLGIGG